MKIQRLIFGFSILLSLLLLLALLWWHYQLGLVRYFDVDEFAHLHWTSQILLGQRPYVDFFSFFPPGFWWFLAPFIKLSWGGIGPLIATRIVMFFLFVGLSVLAGLVVWQLRRSLLAAVLAATILAFLPLPFDKFLEIRPDLLAALLLTIGLLLELQFLRTKSLKAGFWTGFLYALSILVLTKSLPQVGFGFVIAVLALRSRALPMIFGFFVPLGLFFLWLLTLGDIGLVFYSLTKLPVEANKIAQTFFMSPDLFFYPNEIFYGQPGVSQGLVVNHALWIIGMLVGFYRLFIPFHSGKRGIWQELLVSSTFVMHIAFYVLYYPLKHTQYLMPIAVFVAIYAADGVGELWKMTALSKIGSIAFVAAFSFGLFVLYQSNRLVNQPKLAWMNAQTLEMLAKIYATIPAGTYIFDPEGPMLYSRDPYYVCCLPFGQFTQYLTRPLPSLSASLEATQAPYIYKGSLDRLSMLPAEDQAYIASHYRESRSLPNILERVP